MWETFYVFFFRFCILYFFLNHITSNINNSIEFVIVYILTIFFGLFVYNIIYFYGRSRAVIKLLPSSSATVSITLYQKFGFIPDNSIYAWKLLGITSLVNFLTDSLCCWGSVQGGRQTMQYQFKRSFFRWNKGSENNSFVTHLLSAVKK